MINVTSLSKAYGKKQVLKSIELSFAKGTISGVVGENGAGKSTLFKCLLGLEQFDGDVSYSGGTLKNVTGFLPTAPYFMTKMTGLEYLQFVCHARDIAFDKVSEKNLFDLPLDRYASNYSTGMKKKLALTGILLQKNEVFILDEPFNGVDISSNILIKDILLKLKELNKVVVLSSHIFSTLNEVADTLHYLRDGRLEKSVGKEDFGALEKEMSHEQIGNKMDILGLT